VSDAVGPLVVLGIGNALLGDDAVGIRVLEALERVAGRDRTLLPPDTRLVDGGTLGLDLMGTIDGARAVLLLDAVDIDAAPGEVVVLTGDAITTAGARRPGGPAGGIGELLATARLMDWFRGPVALVGVQVEHVAFATRLTPAVEAAVPVAVETARRTLRRLDADAQAPMDPAAAHAMEMRR
jgi:hydrogenase maturation protease